MASTCIICGDPAGSGEHVFPAALGGRRTNKQIYCKEHDNGYASLVGCLASQLDLFNSLLGVRPDHGFEPKSVQARDELSGQIFDLSVKGAKFQEPRVISRQPVNNGALTQMAFSDLEAFKTWRNEQKAKGVDIEMHGKPTKRTYFLSTVQLNRQFGGPYGLAAVGYVTQTFLAQAFPDVVRTSALDGFKKYTQSMAEDARKKEGAAASWRGDPLVWWDFDPQPEQARNSFKFGHRVTVGVDSSDGLIFGRISFFSTLHFSMIFGVTTDPVKTKAVTIDIDPLANHPPNDFLKREQYAAFARVSPPEAQTIGLENAIKSGKAEELLNELMIRLSEFDLSRTAEAMYDELKNACDLAPEKRRELFAAALEKRSQRIWNAIRTVVSSFKDSLHEPVAGLLTPMLDACVALDADSSNGLSDLATHSLELAHIALLDQLLKDQENGTLSVQRVSDLMGSAPGYAVVGAAVLSRLADSIKPLEGKLEEGN